MAEAEAAVWEAADGVENDMLVEEVGPSEEDKMGRTEEYIRSHFDPHSHKGHPSTDPPAQPAIKATQSTCQPPDLYVPPGVKIENQAPHGESDQQRGSKVSHTDSNRSAQSFYPQRAPTAPYTGPTAEHLVQYLARRDLAHTDSPQHSVQFGDSSRTHTHKVSLLWRLKGTKCTIQSDLGTHLGLRSKVVPLPWMILRTSRPLATNRHTQSDYGTHFGLRCDVVTLPWSFRKTSRPLATNRHTQSDYGTHFGLRRDVVPLLWRFRKTSRPLAPNRHTQSDYGTHFGLRRDVVTLP
ncbi:unnamed protein product [Boreogadus saida]